MRPRSRLGTMGSATSPMETTMAFSEDHPRIVALEYAVQFLSRLLRPEDAALYQNALRATGDQFMEQTRSGSPDRALVAVEISAALTALADRAQPD